MEKEIIRKGVTLITLREGETWTGEYVSGKYLQAFIKMLVGEEGYKKDSDSLLCPSHRETGRLVVSGPAVFERHYHSYL